MSAALSFGCKPGCHDCCGIIPFRPKEWEAVALEAASLGITAKAFPEINAVIPDTINGNCPFIGADGCTIYDRRPMICRIFGSVDHPMMTCPHGCGPAKKLTHAEAQRMLGDTK